MTSTRRDVRYALRPGSATIEIPDVTQPGGRWVAELNTICVAGLAFAVTSSSPAVKDEDRFESVTVRVGDCIVRGDVTVRNTRRTAAGAEVGCLFYPSSGEGETTWMILLAGIEAVQVS